MHQDKFCDRKRCEFIEGDECTHPECPHDRLAACKSSAEWSVAQRALILISLQDAGVSVTHGDVTPEEVIGIRIVREEQERHRAERQREIEDKQQKQDGRS